MSRVIILNPWDAQGNQITDSDGTCHTIRGCGGAGYQQGYILQRMTYQTKTGTLSPGAHPGSYNGQDAWNDMLVTDGISNGNWTGECRNNAGGVSNIDG